MNLKNLFLKSSIRYSQGWEDHKVIEEGLEINKNDSIASIISSGDNILNLLLFEPKKIYAYDISMPQIFELKLKIAAIKYLQYSDFIKLLGYSGNGKNRIKILKSINHKLDDETSIFWKKNKKIIYKGLAFQGTWEKQVYFWKYLIKLLLGKDYKKYIESESIKYREKIFEKRIDRNFLRLLSKIFINKFWERIFFDEITVKNIPNSIYNADYFWEKIKHFFVDINCKNNQYHYWIFTGKLLKNTDLWQPYLQEKNFKILKNNIDKIKINNTDFLSGIKNLKDNSIDCINLSDAFDWMNYHDVIDIYSEIVRIVKNQGKIIIFVLNVDHEIPIKYKEYIFEDPIKNHDLWRKERLGLYKKIHRLEIRK